MDELLHNPALIDAAVTLFDRPVVEPAIVFANLMLPGQELAVHTDVPEFRGASRKNLPQWLLVVMHHSGLFDGGACRSQPGSPTSRTATPARCATGPTDPTVTPPASRCAPTPRSCSTPTPSSTASTLWGHEAEAPRPATGATLARWARRGVDPVPPRRRGDRRVRLGRAPVLRLLEGLLLHRPGRPRRLAHPRADLTVDTIVERLVADLAERGLAELTVPRDPDLGRLLIDSYVRFPATA